jgi:hypothetical protein
MSVTAKVDLFFGDGDKSFRLRIGELRELQDKTGAGPLALFRRLIAGEWRVDDLREIIRLGAIGGGMEPLHAADLVKRYVDARPLLESVDPALQIMSAALTGSDEEMPPKGKPEAPAERTKFAGAT